jgi:hypothetical protein
MTSVRERKLYKIKLVAKGLTFVIPSMDWTASVVGILQFQNLIKGFKQSQMSDMVQYRSMGCLHVESYKLFVHGLQWYGNNDNNNNNNNNGCITLWQCRCPVIQTSKHDFVWVFGDGRTTMAPQHPTRKLYIPRDTIDWCGTVSQSAVQGTTAIFGWHHEHKTNMNRVYLVPPRKMPKIMNTAGWRLKRICAGMAKNLEVKIQKRIEKHCFT